MAKKPRALHEKFLKLREDRGGLLPDVLQGVTKERIRQALQTVGLGGNDIIDGVFALLDDETDSIYSRVPAGTKFKDGASTGQIACHIGILQRGNWKLDREGRDYWIKPLREIGGIETFTLMDGKWIPGHVVAKSPNSCYRLNGDLVDILRSPDGEWQKRLAAWSAEDVARERLAFQAEMEQEAKKLLGNPHVDLIQASIDRYARRFLPGYEVLYVDDGDGDRVSDEERDKMKEAGVELTLDDSWPDALLWNPETDWLWVIEAVTSDGEVDFHKVAQMERLAKRHGKAGVGFTTTYLSWKDAAARQGKHGNVAIGSFIWIQGDPAKVFKVEG